MPPVPTFTPGPRSPDAGANLAYAQSLFRELLKSSIVLAEDWELLDPTRRATVSACRNEEDLIQRLTEAGLLNQYQSARLRARKTFGLTLGNYRVLDRLGAGGMGVIYLAEHIHLRKKVAIKALTNTPDIEDKVIGRFQAEMREVAQLRHPNIVSVIDAGHERSLDPDAGTLHYFVMEYLPGQDLEAIVHAKGPVAAERACQFAHQIADALLEAHRHKLVHRDIKPSNILITPEQSAKLLDFGLARTRFRLTEPGSVLGTLGYMAPEQCQDATTVDERADIYSLGATLFWALTAQDPFPLTSNVAQDLSQRLSNPPPSARAIRPQLPVGLDEVVRKMMAVRAADRFPNAQAVMRALLPYVDARRFDPVGPARPSTPPPARPAPAGPFVSRAHHRVLVVDDEPGIRTFCALALKADGIECEEAADGLAALEKATARPFDLVLLDIDMPRLNGTETMRRLRVAPPVAHLKVVLFSGRTAAGDMAQMLAPGTEADEYLPKPFSLVELRARVKAQLRLKDAEDRSDLLKRHLLTVNAELEKSLSAKDVDLVGARNSLVLALAKLVEKRNDETGAHLFRIQRFCRALGDQAMAGGDFGPAIDAAFVHTLEACAPLHDIGKVALPDHILLKPGKLDPEERLQMQSHTIAGCETLREVAKKHGFAAGFLQMGADIARSHHERWDGTGYPDNLAGEDIPLAARFVAVADVYDALRSRRVYKPALPHNTAIMTMTEGSAGHFDPKLMKVFHRCLPNFEQIFRECCE
jgi:response regulator RpfG family c-di-GMP phosphodiesterase